mmetsp:Transcript_6757/g.11618  ORF Transcript_6757/g.11618 Transcript_6757/m.11618 type:complete len:453 (+) Transcript_6757:65-1423(+)
MLKRTRHASALKFLSSIELTENKTNVVAAGKLKRENGNPTSLFAKQSNKHVSKTQVQEEAGSLELKRAKLLRDATEFLSSITLVTEQPLIRPKRHSRGLSDPNVPDVVPEVKTTTISPLKNIEAALAASFSEPRQYGNNMNIPLRWILSRQSARVFVRSVEGGAPALIFSILRYDPKEEEEKAKRKNAAHYIGSYADQDPDSSTTASDDSLSKQKTKKGVSVSYGHLLEPSWATDSEGHEFAVNASGVVERYNANYLDDPEIRSGKHRTVINLAGYMASVIPYVKAKELQDELNKQFHIKHSWIHTSITLSKIRNLKRQILEIALAVNIEVATVALAVIYFEKLVMKSLVTKPNRRLIADVCLLVATKFSDPAYPDCCDALFEQFEEVHKLSRKDILRAEWPVLVDLEFALHVELSNILTHFQRLLALLDKNPSDYLGPYLYRTHFVHDPRS